MLDRDGIVKRLTIANVQANREIDTLKGMACPDPSEFSKHIYQYVIYKFLLDDEENLSDTHNLNELAKLSVAKAGKLNQNEATLLDVSKHCGATSSFMTKKVLLFMSLSEAFSFQYAPYNTADIETTDDLALIIMEKIGAASAKKRE